MISSQTFIQAASGRGFHLYTGVPCSYLRPFINYVIDHPDLRYVGAANEGDAVALAAGAQVGGRGAVVMFQNSGLGNAVNPLTSLNLVAGIPVLLIVTLRGWAEDPPDEPQHGVMGGITTRMLELMGIPWSFFPGEEEVEPVLDAAVEDMRSRRRPHALLMRQGTVPMHALRSSPQRRSRSLEAPPAEPWPPVRRPRAEYLRAVQEACDPGDVIVATTGYAGRELYAIGDRPNQLYMVGSMGCASSFGLGLALAQPRRRVVVVDGDGAALMRLGALATIGYERPENLVHVLLDNEAHESTGAQSTTSHSVDLGAVARACGYPRVARVGEPAALGEVLRQRAGLTFLHVKTALGVLDKLPRPKISPADVVGRLRAHLAGPA